MYGKSFESKFEGSMVGAGFHVYSVWDYCITKNRSGFIELNPKLLAFVLDGGRSDSELKVTEAIEFLSQPDSKSRNKAEDGRRLVKEGEYQYRMVNWQHYESIKSIADLREYNRRKQAEYRARKAERKKAKKSGPLKGEEETLRRVDNGELTQDQADDIAAGTREG